MRIARFSIDQIWSNRVMRDRTGLVLGIVAGAILGGIALIVIVIFVTTTKKFVGNKNEKLLTS